MDRERTPQVASGSADKTIVLWRIADGSILRMLRAHCR